ncbi:MAG: BON domain-containing protein [Methylocystis sp.]|jgi:OOP family OmpA-OmpF porin
MPRPGKWWIGLPILAGIIYLAGDTLTRRIELDLTNRAAQLVAEEKGALDGAEVIANGREIVISGVVLSAPGRDKALLAIGQMDGARAALDQTRPVETVHPFALKMERKGLRVTLDGAIPPGGERDRLRKELIVQGLEIIDHSRYAEGAPAVFPELAGFAARRLAEMDPGVATLSDDALSLMGDALPEIDLEKLVAAAKSPPEGARIEKMEIYPPRVSPYGWSAARKGEMVALEGFVPSGEARAHVIEKAGGIAAGAAVSDAMRIGSGAPSGDFLGAVDVALAELGKLASGKVALNDASLSVEGAGRTNVLAAMIEEDAKATLPRGFSLTKIEVVDGVASPYVLAATLKDGTLTLTGYVPDAAARDEIRAVAKKGAAVIDELKLAGGAPKDFARAVVAALPALERLSSGVLTLSDNGVALEGEAPFAGAAADIGPRLASALPQGFASAAQLTARDPGPPLEATDLQKAINDALAKTPLLFDGPDATLSDSATPALDALAALLPRGRGAHYEIIGYIGGPGIEEVNRGLAKQRARAVIDRLTAFGVDPASLAPVGVAGQAQGGGAIEVVAK